MRRSQSQVPFLGFALGGAGEAPFGDIFGDNLKADHAAPGIEQETADLGQPAGLAAGKGDGNFDLGRIGAIPYLADRGALKKMTVGPIEPVLDLRPGRDGPEKAFKCLVPGGQQTGGSRTVGDIARAGEQLEVTRLGVRQPAGRIAQLRFEVGQETTGPAMIGGETLGQMAEGVEDGGELTGRSHRLAGGLDRGRRVILADAPGEVGQRRGERAGHAPTCPPGGRAGEKQQEGDRQKKATERRRKGAGGLADGQAPTAAGQGEAKFGAGRGAGAGRGDHRTPGIMESDGRGIRRHGGQRRQTTGIEKAGYHPGEASGGVYQRDAQGDRRGATRVGIGKGVRKKGL